MNQNLLPEYIIESWNYCSENMVNPFSRKSIERLSKQKLVYQKKKMAHIIQFVKEEIKRLNEFFNVKKPLFILTDSEGVVLWREGHHETRNRANDICFLEGSIWTEKAVGTNAIGIALRTAESVSVERFQHFSEASHPFTCTSTPILDGENQVIACLNVSTMEQLNETNYTLFALKMIAKNVQQKVTDYQKKQFLDGLTSPFEQAFLVQLNGHIFSVSEDLEASYKKWEGKQITDIINDKRVIYEKEKIYWENRLIGFCYRLKVEKPHTTFVSFGVPSKNKTYQLYLDQLSKAAKSELPIHIYGETGSGKEISAKTIHYNSTRNSGKLISVNCGALSESLLEGELFGYVAGAFTGANPAGYRGKIEQADKGTLFLDEIDSMSKRMQVALLRVIEEKKFSRLGSDEESQVDFRIVTASNKNLKELVKNNDFREDLFYRLYVIPLTLPPLRQRQEDFEVLVDTFCEVKKWTPLWKKKISEGTKEFEWHGNIREFQNFLERLYLYFPSKEPSRQELIELISVGAIKEKSNENHLADERKTIVAALKETNYHLTQTAGQLQMARSTLYRKMAKYQIELPK